MNISIGLAVYNGEQFLVQQLQSLISQSIKPFEIVIVNDCSTDGSELIIRQFDFGGIPVRFINNDQNLGVIATFRKILTICEGDFIALCDQDDIWLPNKLELCLNEFNFLNPKQPCVVFSDLTLIDKDGNVIEDSLYKSWGINPKSYSIKSILFDNVIVGCTVLINREMRDLLISIPLGIVMHDYWIALIAYSFGDYRFVDVPTILYRSHNASVTSKIKGSWLVRARAEYANRKSYLESHFLQASLFLDNYCGYLSCRDKLVFSNFLMLRGKPFVVKRCYAKMLKLLIKLKSRRLSFGSYNLVF